MDTNQPLPRKVPDLTYLGGKVLVLRVGFRSWLWRFLGISLLATVIGCPASLAGGVRQETSPPAKAQNAWLTASASVVVAADTITFDPVTNQIVGATVTVSASSSSGLPVFLRSDTTPVCTVANSTVTTVAAGLCTITASDDSDAHATLSFQVNQAAQTITFGQPPDVTIGAPVTLSASASSGLPVSFTSDTTPVCTVANSTVTTVAAGLCTITASQAGNTDYAAAPPVTQSFQVNPAAQTITFGQPPDVTIGAPVTLSASASSGLTVSFSSDTSSVCTVAGSVVTTVAAGPCTITASQGGSARYAAAPDVSRSFQVNPVKAGPTATPATTSPSVTGPGPTISPEPATTTPPAVPIRQASGPVPKQLTALLVAVASATVAGALTLAMRGRRRGSRPRQVTPASDVRAVADSRRPGVVNVRDTGRDPTHTVRFEPDHGTRTTTTKEKS